jgi:hypothetical protein
LTASLGLMLTCSPKQDVTAMLLAAAEDEMGASTAGARALTAR